MTFLEKYQSLVIFIAVILGLFLGQLAFFKTYAGSLITPFFMMMLYIVFLHIPFNDIMSAFKNIRFTITSLIINFIWTPLLVWGLGSFLLLDNPALWIGFIMLMVTPCTDWYLVFTGIAKGNLALGTAILPLNLLLQLILLPLYLLIFAGTFEIIDFSILIESILFVLLVPLILAYTTRFMITKKLGVKWLEDNILDRVSSLQITFLSLAIVAMFASQGELLMQNLDLLIKLLLPILLFFSINFILGQVVGNRLKFSYEDKVSLNLVTLARNSPIALAIAMTAFPNEPLIALALVVGPLIELPLLAGITQVLLLLRKRQDHLQNNF